MKTINILVILLVVSIYNDFTIADNDKRSKYENVSINSIHSQNTIEDQSVCSDLLFERLENIDSESVIQSEMLILNFYQVGGQIGCYADCIYISINTFCCYVFIGPHPRPE